MVSIAISYLNRADLWRRTLLSIGAQLESCGEQVEIVVVNDTTPDGVFERICRDFNRKHGPVIRAFNTGRTMNYRGPAYPWNCAIRESRGDVLIIQNPELLHVGPVIASLSKMLQDSAAKRFICSRTVSLEEADNHWLDQFESQWLDNYRLLHRLDYPCRQEYVGASNPRYFYFMAGIRREHMLQVGGLSEEFVYLGYEDNFNEFLMRQNGFSLEIPDSGDWFGLHQWHSRPQSDSEYHRVHQISSGLNQQLQREILAGAPAVANHMPWGILPEGAEIAL